MIINSYAYAAPVGDIVTNLKYPISGNYPSNDVQTWSYSLVNNGFNISFNSFNTESNFDFLRIYEGTSDTGLLIKEFSGASLPADIYVYGNMFLKFTSDSSTNGTGFDIDITDSDSYTSCGRIIDYPADNKLDAPFIGLYKGNATQTWLIPNNSGATNMSISFSAFNLENTFDFLRVYEGNDDTGVLLATLTGTTIPSDVSTISGGNMFLKFTSDAIGNFTGFVCTINCL